MLVRKNKFTINPENAGRVHTFHEKRTRRDW